MQKVYLITGAGHFPGIGSCLAEKLLTSGQCVVVNSRKFDLKWTELQEQYPDSVRIVSGDITDSDVQDLFVSTAISTWGRLDVIVNNAGSILTSDNPDRAEWSADYLINVITPYELAVKAKSYLDAVNGSVIMISSRLATQVGVKPGNANNLSYGVAKSAMNHLARSLAVLLSPNIRVNVVASGLVTTARHKFKYTEEQYAKTKQTWLSASLIQDTVKMDSIVDSVIFLADNASITGQILPVCNGAGMHKI
jgi:NAD(P)-dependent dehydrogenase (short-subunit alcohol dehydrogenase family)